jgi:DNA-binding SARP family transcriptional activator/TolB-like protein
MAVESDRAGAGDALEVRLLGPLAIRRGGVPLTLPASRKVRALLVYLLLAPRAVPRARLCELLWDVPNDPRGELRWCLSKIRRIVDDADCARIEARDDAIRLDLTGCRVDAIEVAGATREGVATLSAERLRRLAALFGGEVLDGLEVDRSPSFNAWLTAQRRRFRGCHVALLEHLVAGLSEDEAFPHLEKWLQLAPFDQRAHAALLEALAGSGRLQEGEEHLAAAARLFEAEGLDPAPLRALWQAARGRHSSASQHGSPGTIAAVRSQAANVTTGAPAEHGLHHPTPTPDDRAAGAAARRASVAVMPFAGRCAASGVPGGPADGLAHDVITGLAKLRSLFVIAQGSVFALRDRRIAPEEAGRMLNVDYVVSGALQRQGARLTVEVELAETRTARIVWAEVFNQTADDAFLVLDTIGDRIVTAVDREIEASERNRAILRPPSSLDAWEAHHRGLWHMYRFNRADNERAQQLFATAVRLDPTFARAHAGLSFTHFQNAFQGWAERATEIDRAYAAAGQSLMADDRDPAAHWAMGRALWLRGNEEQSLRELTETVALSPNFALGHYTLAFVHAQSGDPDIAVQASDHSRHLSPFDPLLFGMLGARAMALVRLRRFDEAADWGVKAAARPNAHPHILAIAAYCSALAGRYGEGYAHLAALQTARPDYAVDDFLTAMRFSPDDAALFRTAAAALIGRS